MNFISTIGRWFGFGGFALRDQAGEQRREPSSSLGESSPMGNADAALQIAAVWACVERLAVTIASLPMFVYEAIPGKPGQRQIARGTDLFSLLHDTPNSRMTPMEFWVAMLINRFLRGNGYARIERDSKGRPYALWPMSADQVAQVVLDDGSLVYEYRIGSDVAIIAAENVLHIKGIGNGTIGLSRLDYMRATTEEARNAQLAGNRLFANGGKPTGVLMFDGVLKKDQRDAVKKNFAELAVGGTDRLIVLEANMKYQQVSLTPQDMQLLTTRQFSKSEIGTWFGVPSILINQTEGTTTLGSSAAEIIESFYKLTIRPELVAIEQALRKRVMTAEQRARYTAEFSQDALLRASLKDRTEIYAKAVQNGLKTRNECRQLENDPPIDGGDQLTAQTNLAPIGMLGRITQGAANAGTQNPVAQ